MDTYSWHFFILYLLFPLIALVTGVAMYFLNKRIGLFENKKIIIILFSSALILGLPGILGLVDYWFMPYIYLTLSLLYFLLGIYNLSLINWLFKELLGKNYAYEAIFILTQLIMGVALFSLLFNLCNEGNPFLLRGLPHIPPSAQDLLLCHIFRRSPQGRLQYFRTNLSRLIVQELRSRLRTS